MSSKTEKTDEKKKQWEAIAAGDNYHLTPMGKIQRWLDFVPAMKEFGGHDALLASIIKPTSAISNPTPQNPHHSVTIFEMVVPRQFCNMTGHLHGGAVALIFDTCTSATISAVSRRGFWDTGHVSRTLNCTYLRPTREGSTITVESEVVQLGKTSAVTRGIIRNEDGKVAYTCEHGKAPIGGPSL